MTSLLITGLILYIIMSDAEDKTFAWILLIALILFGSSEPSPESQTKIPQQQQQEKLHEQ